MLLILLTAVGSVPRGELGWTTRAETTLLPQTRLPPPNPTCPLLLNPPSPTTTTSTPPPPLLSLSLSISLSLSSLPQSGHSSSLFSCPSLHPSTILRLPPPAATATQCRLYPACLHLRRLTGFQAATFPKLPCEDFFILDLFWVLHPSPLERPAGVCVCVCASLWCVCLACVRQRVQGLWCRALCPEGVPKGCDWRRKVSTTMNVQLLLLLALVGPFCAFTHASK